ncbi:DUF929 family protein [Flindersiella endophytica]
MASSKAQRRRAGQEAARAKVAAMRAEQERADRRRRLGIVAAVLAGVLVVVGGIVAISVTRDTDSARQSGDLPASVLKAATSVPPSVLEQIGKGSAVSLPAKASGKALAKAGKPQVLYVGAEYCPYCAAERWSMVVALSRFGTFSGLGATTSGAEDVYPNTPTFTFHGSTFSSDYIDFVGKELNTNQRAKNGNSNGYAPLDKLTAGQEAEFDKLTNGENSFPFVDFAGKFTIRGTQYDPKVLEGKSMEQIADALKDPKSPIAQAINGSANTITAAVCETTGGKPANVCGSSAISSLRGQLGDK